MIDPLNFESVKKQLVCPETLNDNRTQFAIHIVKAYQIVLSFAAQNNWKKYLNEPLFSSVYIFESQKELWNKIRELSGSDDENSPTDGLSAALINRCLLTVTPETYKQLRPEYNQISDSWPRLLAHEMMHELHVRIIGNEDKMGPQWFFEGFAMYGSGQQFGNQIDSFEEALTAIHSHSRGSYAKFSAAFDFFVKHINLELMLKRAHKPDFESWLAKTIL